MLKKEKINLKSTVIPAKRSVSGNPSKHQSICHSSLDGEPQATPTGGPVRDERSEQSHQLPAFAGMTESGRSTPTCHPWTSVSEIRGSSGCGLNAPRCARYAQSGRSSSSLSFPCLTRESIGRGLNALHFTRFAQSGRSMVEMLGVLAVMGIISIGGVYGYTKAMERHRANELLNEANKRAVMVASQLMAGRDPENVTIGEIPKETPYGTFSANITSDGNDKFKMTVSGLDKATCDLLTSFAGGPLRHVSCQKSGSIFTAEMFFNKDLSTSEKASDYNGNQSACEADSSRQYCAGNDTCISATETCPPTGPACAGVECPEGTTCGVAGNCIAPSPSAMTIGCSNNSDCNDWCASQSGAVACYCKISATNTGTDNACYNNFVGACATISNTEKTNKYSSQGRLTWWSAKNFCQAINEPMPSKNSACNGNYSGCFPILSSPYWLSDCRGTDCTDNSCNASAVTNSSGSVTGANRNQTGFAIALCG